MASKKDELEKAKEEKLLRFIKLNSPLTMKTGEIKEATGFSYSSLKYVAQRLEDKGLIKIKRNNLGKTQEYVFLKSPN